MVKYIFYNSNSIIKKCDISHDGMIDCICLSKSPFTKDIGMCYDDCLALTIADT